MAERTHWRKKSVRNHVMGVKGGEKMYRAGGLIV